MYYPGNKNIPGILQKILNEIPKHSIYWELFAGGAGIGKALPEGTVKHFNDIDIIQLEKLRKESPGEQTFFHSFNALDLIQSFSSVDRTDIFLFADPPYLHSTRSNSTLYRKEMTYDDHSYFLFAAVKLKIPTMIIHPICDLYNFYLEDWRCITVKIRYNKKTSVEGIWMNYNKPQELQTYKFIGKDCWDRQRIKRKAERFHKKGLPIVFPDGSYLTDMFPTY